MPFLAGSLLLAGLVSPALAQVRTLYQNDLSLNSTSTPALYLSDTVLGGAEVTAACAAYNEQPLPTVTEDLQDQLNYLIFRKELTNSSQVYIAQSAAVSARSLRFDRRQAGCTAYNLQTRAVESISCATSLPVLCTNSAPPSVYPLGLTPNPGSQVTVSTANASFVGYRDARSFRFLGIPFAQPPVGDLRFRAAQPFTGGYENFNATTLGPGCIQDGGGLSSPGGSTVYSEDCLSINVYSPLLPSQNSSSNSTTLLPVAYWIYGGAFTSGANNLPDYDGGNMASRGDVVVVTVNYRLGALGFLASPSLNGSQGITDQIQGLRWVQEHISAFGGDPADVTIYGESAGAESVLAIMSSTPASGLFSRAISQSAPWQPFVNREVYTDGVYPAILNATNCTTATDEAGRLACLRALPATTFIDASVIDQAGAGSAIGQTEYAQVPLLLATVQPFLPTVGTGVIDGLPNRLVSAGRLPAAGIPLLIGNMADEGTLFVESVPQLMNPVPALPVVLNLLLSQSFDNTTAAAIANNTILFGFNTTDPDALRTLAAELITLDTWQCPLQAFLSQANSQDTFSALYSYSFRRGSSQSQTQLGFPAGCSDRSASGVDRVCHAEDVPLVFGTNNIRGSLTPFDAGAQGFSQYIQDVWSAFIRTGNPQPSAAYLTARGQAYATSLQYSQAAPFGEYAGASSNSSIQLLDTPPRRSGILYPEECQVLQDAGFLYQNVAPSTGSAA